MATGRVKKQHKGIQLSWQRMLKALLLVAFVAIAIFSANKIKSNEFFPIHSVKIFGAQHLEHADVQKLVSPLIGNGFFAVDVDKIKERILQMPWVADVVVRRVWPDLVVVAINEKSPVALWNDNSLLSSAGELFTPNKKSYPDGLPTLSGPPGEHILMAQYYAKMSSILSPLHCKITRLELTPAMAWKLTFDNGTKLTIGHKDILTRLNHFVKVYPKVIGDRIANVDYIDLRYPNGMAVKWKSVT